MTRDLGFRLLTMEGGGRRESATHFPLTCAAGNEDLGSVRALLPRRPGAFDPGQSPSDRDGRRRHRSASVSPAEGLRRWLWSLWL